MFGSHEFGTPITFGTITIETYKEGGLPIYYRPPVKKVMFPSRLIIHPVEPVTQPREITHYLLTELDPSILLAPGDSLTFFVTFPIEIGVYIRFRKHVERIDSFTLTSPKYTLYGTPDSGIICKWWKSKISSNFPEISPFIEGIMKVNAENTGNDWAELKKIVFDAYLMKIYYKAFACMNAEVKVTNPTVARTSFVRKPIQEGMKKALELFTLRKLPIVERNEFVMEWGL